MPREKANSNTTSSVTVSDDQPSQLMHWLTQTKLGQQGAFSYIVEYYQRPIHNLCYRMLGDSSEAEDAAQETFIRAYLKLKTYDENYKFSTWLFAIASHHCLDRLRKRRYTQVAWDELPVEGPLTDELTPQPEQVTIKAETARTIHNLLRNLQPDYRLTIVLKYWHNKSCEEIADITQTTVGAVKSRLFRARQQLANRLTLPTAPRPQPAMRPDGLSALTQVCCFN